MSVASKLVVSGDQMVRLDEITVGERLRGDRDVSDIVASFALVGQLQPIILRDSGHLVSGRGRMLAAQALGWERIWADVREIDDEVAEIIEIDENLARPDLTVLEQAEHLARRNQLLEVLGQRATPADGAALRDGDGPPVTVTGGLVLTTAALAAQVGMGERTLRRRWEVSKIAPDVRKDLHGTPVANSLRDLLTLADQDELGQRAIVAMLGKEGMTVRRALSILRPTNGQAHDDEDDDYEDPSAAERLRVIDGDNTLRFDVPSGVYRTRGDAVLPTETEIAEHHIRRRFNVSYRQRGIAGLSDLLDQMKAETMRDKKLLDDWVRIP